MPAFSSAARSALLVVAVEAGWPRCRSPTSRPPWPAPPSPASGPPSGRAGRRAQGRPNSRPRSPSRPWSTRCVFMSVRPGDRPRHHRRPGSPAWRPHRRTVGSLAFAAARHRAAGPAAPTVGGRHGRGCRGAPCSRSPVGFALGRPLRLHRGRHRRLRGRARRTRGSPASCSRSGRWAAGRRVGHRRADLPAPAVVPHAGRVDRHGRAMAPTRYFVARSAMGLFCSSVASRSRRR